MISNYPPHNKLSNLWHGCRRVLPVMLGVVPFGLIVGVTASAMGLTPLFSVILALIVFAGSAQIMVIQLIGAGIPLPIMVLTIFIINLRHMMYSASLAPYLSGLSKPWKWFLAYFLTDEAYAVTIVEFDQEKEDPNKHWFFLGAGFTLWFLWQISVALGAFAGAQLPADWPLDFVFPLTFIALIIPTLRDKATVCSALVGGVSAVLLSFLPYKLGLVSAAALGIAAGMIVEAKWKPES